jgi:hypothetical protein
MHQLVRDEIKERGPDHLPRRPNSDPTMPVGSGSGNQPLTRSAQAMADGKTRVAYFEEKHIAMVGHF